MRVCHLAKWVVASFLLSILVACGGGSSSTGCASGGSDCDAGSKIDGMGTDGPLVDAIVRVVRFQEWLNGVGDSVLKTTERSDAAGLASGIELAQGAGPGPFLLQFVADATTTDLTTGVAPVVSQVFTIVSAADFALNPRPRFYATALTTLAIERAKVLAGSNNAALVEAQLATASLEVLNAFGFGLANTTDIFHTAPILDESVTTITDQLVTAAYRTALETFAEVIEQAVTAQGSTNQAIFDAIVADFIVDGLIGNNAPTADQAAVVAAVNSVSPTYLASSDRFPADDGSTNIEELLDGETAVAEPLDGGTGVLLGVLPQEPDFDGDGTPNSSDGAVYDPSVQQDVDLDGVDDVVDNCPTIANGPLAGPNDQLDTDNDFVANPQPADQGGDVCDTDDDGDGVSDGSDDESLNALITIDTDGDLIDDVGGLSPSGLTLNGPDNCVAGKVLFGTGSTFDGFNGISGSLILTIGQAFNPGQEDDDTDGEGNVCDEDADGDTTPGDGFSGEGETRFGIGFGDPDDLDAAVSPTDFDSDGASNLTDSCPLTPNGPNAGTDEQGANNTNSTNNANGTPFGPSCDFDDDGFPDTDEDIASIIDIADGIAVDNCPNDANPAQIDLPDNDGIGDACDLDVDNDGIPNLVDPAPLVAVSGYHFDIFYTQQSSQAGNFKLATISESVLQTAGTTIDTAGSNSLDLGTDGAGTGDYDITRGYETVEGSIDFDQTPCAGVGCLAAATPTVSSATPVLVNTDNTANTAVYSEPTLTFSAETPALVLSPWGVASFVGSGQITLNGVGSTLTASAEQGLTALLYTDDLSNDADLSGTYGFVDLSVAYSSTVTSSLVSTTSRIFDASLDGAGTVSTEGTLSQFTADVGNAEGSISHSSTALGLTTYSVSASGATTIGSLKGITDAEGELIVLSDGDTRGYGVKLGTFASATAAGTAVAGSYDLQGLAIQPGRNKVLAYNFSGASITLADDGAGNVTANLDLTGNTRDRALFDAEDDALPSVDTEASPLAGSSESFTIDPTTGRFGPVTWGSGTGLKQFEMEGFFVAGKGILIRYLESSLYTSGGAGGGGISFFCGEVPADLPVGFIAFVDPTNGNPDPVQPTSGYVCGFIQVGAAALRSKVSSDAIVSSPQVYTTLEGAPTSAAFVEDSFGQGVVWAIPQ